MVVRDVQVDPDTEGRLGRAHVEEYFPRSSFVPQEAICCCIRRLLANAPRLT